jgi:hypothetical protein
LAAGLGAPTRSFGLSGPWALLSPATTNSSGNYAVRAYAPGTYTFDFSPLSDLYMTASVKLTCEAASAVIPATQVPPAPPECLTQPCAIIQNISFGFWKIYDGWWQAVGGNVHGDTGVQSIIPSSLDPLVVEMSLILPDATAGNRRGFLSYGVTRPTDMLGKNPNAKVSTNLWEKESLYGGQVYDWNFYNSRFKRFTTTAWGDLQAITYDDLGVGYQIFKSTESISTFSFNPTGTQKAIFIVDGDILIDADIVVPANAFLTVIASGRITFAANVTQADGWYIAGNIAVPCRDVDSDGCDKNDSMFSGNGSFIAWNGFSLARTRGVLNNSGPSEKFTYRQDLYQNAPEPMKIYIKYFKPFVP